jgi:molybdopterin-containing oxidoreductase family membrane subunit
MFSPTFVDIGIFIGTIGFFFVLFLLYSRTFPVIAQAEVKSILKSSADNYKALRAEGKPLYKMPPRGKVTTYEVEESNTNSTTDH